MIRTIAGSLAAAVVVAVSGGPAQAAWTGPSPAPRPAHAGYPGRPRAYLKLTYLADSGYATEVILTCHPEGGGHPDPAQACATLAKVGADPDKIAPAHLLCTMIYSPITAEIAGTWRGEPIDWSHRFGNRCEMIRATGMLFKF